MHSTGHTERRKRRINITNVYNLCIEPQNEARDRIQTFLDAVSGSMMPPGVLVGASSFSTRTRFSNGITRLLVDILLVLQLQRETASHTKPSDAMTSRSQATSLLLVTSTPRLCTTPGTIRKARSEAVHTRQLYIARVAARQNGVWSHFLLECIRRSCRAPVHAGQGAVPIYVSN